MPGGSGSATGPRAGTQAIATPTPAQVRAWTGVNRFITGAVDDDALDTALQDLIEEAEPEVALTVGETRFDGSDWTARQAKNISRGWAYLTASLFLVSPYVEKVTGTQEPMVMEDAEFIAEAANALRKDAQRLLGLSQAGTVDELPFAMPAAASSTYTRAYGDRDPVGRNDLLNEMDDISGDDVGRG